MNQNITNNSGLHQVNSFVTNKLNAVNNVANSVANTVSNGVSNLGNTFTNTINNIKEPINDSINAAINNNSSPFVSISVILTLGILIVLFIIIVIFRVQIIAGFELIWKKIKEFLGIDKPAVIPPPPAFVPEQQFIEQGAMEKLLPGKKEVFNVAQNKYTYTDAEPLCKAFGAELATYDQVKEAWQKGADWCNYGWVKGQAAVYPTQQDTFNKMQQGPEDQRMACGTPGVNGGYFDNPELRFGVNCYGVKPSESENDIRNIMAQNGDLTPGALEFDKKVLGYKAHLGEIPVNPFKEGQWA
jgi:hypothetical protein